MIIQDWTWSQVPPPVLAVEPHTRDAEHVIIGMADPADGMGEDGGDLCWSVRRLTAEQADELAVALRERAAALRGTPLTSNGGDVPARLEAAADVLGNDGAEYTADALRMIAAAIREDATAEVRAAVAAALARPAGHQP